MFYFIFALFLMKHTICNHVSDNKINTIGSRLGDSAVLPCGVNMKKLLPHDKNGLLTVPVLVNWFRHYSLSRKSERPIYAKYLAHLIDYEPHIEREFENRLQIVDQVNLNISNLKTTDEGIYECKLIFFDKAYTDNQNGSLAYLQIYVAPEFENLSDEIYYLKPHMPIRLYCYSRGKPTPTITWYKNGKKLNLNSSLLYEVAQENNEIDLIEYKCVAENLIDTIEYKFKVIKSGSLIFSQQLKNQTIVEGMLLNWPCIAQSNVDISYKWYKDSIAVQTYLKKWPDRGAVFQDGMLYLSETLREDTGFYECHAYTNTRRVQTRAYLDVVYPPEIFDFENVVYALEGSNILNIECNTKANPSVHTYEWYKNNDLLSNNNKYNIHSNGSLTVKHVKKADHGEYYCTAQNSLKKTFSIKLKLKIISNNKKTDSIQYASTSFNIYKIVCKGPNVNNSAIKWYKVGSKLPKNRHSVEENGDLSLINLNRQDSGYYLCVHYIEKGIEDKMLDYDQLIRLIIVENSTIKTPEIDVKSNKILPLEAKNELPLAPVHFKIDKKYSQNEIFITWSYPEQTKIKIEYYQINYRHYNNKTINEDVNTDWITVEPISVTETSYRLNGDDLIENEFYQVYLVSCSIYSQSLKSEIITFKYSDEDVSNDEIEKDLIQVKNLSSKTATFLKSISQVDIILVSVFLLLIFILSICVLACIVYHRSNRYQRKKSIESKDFDDWGFQSTNVHATKTFLPSPSSNLLTNNSDTKTLSTLNRNIKKNCIEVSNFDEAHNDLLQPSNNGDSLNSDSGSNSTTIVSSTNTNSTNLTYKNQRRSLVLQQIKINDNNNNEEDEYTNWLNKPNNEMNGADCSVSSITSIATHQLPQFKQNFSVSIKNSNGTIKRPIVQYPFKTTHQNQDYISIVQNDPDFFKKMNKTYNSLKVDYV